MTTQKAKIINVSGLHARPASEFVQMAKSFESKIMIRNIDRESEFVNAKSIIRLLTAELCMGDTLELTAEGADEAAAVAALIALVESGFGE